MLELMFMTLGECKKKKSFRRVSQRVGLLVEFQKALYKMLTGNAV